MKKYLFTVFVFLTTQINAEIKLEDCASIKSDVKRLACYDYIITGESKPSGELSKKELKGSDEKTTVTVSEEEANFGLSNKQKRESDIEVSYLSPQHSFRINCNNPFLMWSLSPGATNLFSSK